MRCAGRTIVILCIILALGSMYVDITNPELRHMNLWLLTFALAAIAVIFYFIGELEPLADTIQKQRHTNTDQEETEEAEEDSENRENDS